MHIINFLRKLKSTLQVVVFNQLLINLLVALYSFKSLKKNDLKVPNKWFSRYYGIIFLVIMVLLTHLVIKRNIVELFTINGDGIKPIIHDKQIVLVVKTNFIKAMKEISSFLEITPLMIKNDATYSIVIYKDLLNKIYFNAAVFIGNNEDHVEMVDNTLCINNNCKNNLTVKNLHLSLGIQKTKTLTSDNSYRLIVEKNHNLLFVNSLLSSYINSIAEPAILGYVKYIIWDKNKKKFILTSPKYI